jgi:hypothetical protein
MANITITLTPDQITSIAAQQAATPPPPPPPASGLSLIQSTNLTRVAAFRLPVGTPASDANSFAFGGGAMCFNPAGNNGHGSLILAGKVDQGLIGEVSIPTTGTGTTINSLPTAQLVSGPLMLDPCGGHRTDVGSGSDYIGGLALSNGKLLTTVYAYYDGGGTANKSHFVSNGSAPFTYQGGPFQVGTLGGGWVAGPMLSVPPAFAASFGAPWLTGQSCLAVTSRTSQGPSMTAFDPAQLGPTAAPGKLLVGYHANTASITGQETLGDWASSGNLYNGASNYPGAVIIGRTLLFGGRLGKGPFAYGTGTSNQALNGQPVGDGSTYVYDPTDSGKGPHAYPYENELVAYDLNDLALVAAGTKKPYEIVPYAHWGLTWPFGASQMGIGSMAFDPATNRLFIAQKFGDNTAPLIHIFQVS